MSVGKRTLLLLIGLVCVGWWNTSGGATRSPKQRIVPNWSRFEQVFVSSFSYTNPLQEATLTAVFTSPHGETKSVQGFWDGGRIWRVRFCPETPGQWTFTTTCSDRKNDGLDSQSGKFLCTAPIGESAFQRHGPIRVARDRLHFEHADGTPFFWLADTVWNGARVANPKDWERYATIRASQTFNVALWSVVPGDDVEYESALTGFANRIGINPTFFQRLDAKLEILSRDGILSAILPFSELAGVENSALAPDQVVLLYRYMLARWGSEPVSWLIRATPQADAQKSLTWQAIGTAVFGNTAHAPVILLGPDTPAEPNLAGRLSWVDAYGVIVDASASILGSLRTTTPEPGRTTPERPVIVFPAPENSIGATSHVRLSSDQLRRIIYVNVLTRTTAGVSYAGIGVPEWDKETVAGGANDAGQDLPIWEKALFMPGAKQMRPLAKLMETIEFWRLRPTPDAIQVDSTSTPDQDRAVAAVTDAKDLMLVYLPAGKPVQIPLTTMPVSPTVTWLDPRNGSTRSGAAVVADRSCQLSPPTGDDWLLLIGSGR